MKVSHTGFDAEYRKYFKYEEILKVSRKCFLNVKKEG